MKQRMHSGSWATLVAVLVGSLVILSGSLLYAWTGPTAPAPDDNVPAPVNVGTTDQVKDGGLGVSALAVFEGDIFVSAGYGLVSESGAVLRTGDLGKTIQIFGGDPSDPLNYDLLCINSREVLESAGRGGACSGSAANTDKNFKINGQGNVGVGIVSPTSPLHVAKDWVSGPLATFTQEGDGGASIALVKAREWRITSNLLGGLHFADMRSGEIRLRMNTNGTIDGTWGRIHGPSDGRFKTNIRTIRGALDRVRDLRGVFFNWITDENGAEKTAGLIAQEVEQVLPEAVHTATDGTKGVEYDQLIPVLIEAVRELDQKNIELEARIEELES